MISTSIRSENDSLKYSLLQVRQSVYMRESSPSSTPPKHDWNEQTEVHERRRVRRRLSHPISIPSSPPTSTISREEYVSGKGKSRMTP